MTRTSQLLLDVSELAQGDQRTGIQRVTRAIVAEFLARPPTGFIASPVYWNGERFMHTGQFSTEFSQPANGSVNDRPVEFGAGDIYFMPDLSQVRVIQNRLLYQSMRAKGVRVGFMVHDLLPVLHPEWFQPDAAPSHAEWLAVVSEADIAVCVSRSVADELSAWVEQHMPHRHGHLRIEWNHHGVDLEASLPSRGLTSSDQKLLRLLKGRTAFLMVGTVEPRKGHKQVLAAFERIWLRGGKEILIVVGKQGWLMRRFARRMTVHKWLNPRFFWLASASDEMLDALYRSCSCLIAASGGEGFGLPLLEAAKHGVPLIARDIPVFRETTQGHALFFEGDSPRDFAAAVLEWERLSQRGALPKSDKIQLLTWRESADGLKTILSPEPVNEAQTGQARHPAESRVGPVGSER
jgi:glycosyltransferase involved in cell wall biosynthesis